MSLTASQAGENSQTIDPEHTIVSSILTDLIFRRNQKEEQYCRNQYQTGEEAEIEQLVSKKVDWKKYATVMNNTI